MVKRDVISSLMYTMKSYQFYISTTRQLWLILYKEIVPCNHLYKYVPD